MSGNALAAFTGAPRSRRLTWAWGLSGTRGHADHIMRGHTFASPSPAIGPGVSGPADGGQI